MTGARLRNLKEASLYERRERPWWRDLPCDVWVEIFLMVHTFNCSRLKSGEKTSAHLCNISFLSSHKRLLKAKYFLARRHSSSSSFEVFNKEEALEKNWADVLIYVWFKGNNFFDPTASFASQVQPDLVRSVHQVTRRWWGQSLLLIIISIIVNHYTRPPDPSLDIRDLSHFPRPLFLSWWACIGTPHFLGLWPSFLRYQN